MALDDTHLFIAQNKDLSVYNGLPLLNVVITIFDDYVFSFPGYISAYLNIYQSRSETLLTSFNSQLSRNSNNIVLNCSAGDMTFSSNGKYYYELGYIQSGGYSIVLLYGNFNVQ